MMSSVAELNHNRRKDWLGLTGWKDIQTGASANGKPEVSKTSNDGSIPSAPATIQAEDDTSSRTRSDGLTGDAGMPLTYGNRTYDGVER